MAVVPPPGTAVVEVPARRVSRDDALPLLLADGASPFWAAAARLALELVSRGLLLPGVSPVGHDAWRVGPLDPASAADLASLAAAMPASARALPASSPEHSGPVLPAAAPLLRGFAADSCTRCAGSGAPHNDPMLFSVPHLREWTDEVAAGVDAGVAVSLRLEVDPPARMPRATDRWCGCATAGCS